VIEHAFPCGAVGGSAVSSDAPRNGSVNQRLFGYLAKNQVQRSIDGVSRDLPESQLARQPGPAQRLGFYAIVGVTICKQVIVYVAKLL
jgi:hypothetical protein